jgi:hypothetical protein
VIAAEQFMDRPWQPTSSARRPKDGDRAEVRQKNGRQALIRVFFAEPIARWESLDGSQVCEFKFFEHWRAL